MYAKFGNRPVLSNSVMNSLMTENFALPETLHIITPFDPFMRSNILLCGWRFKSAKYIILCKQYRGNIFPRFSSNSKGYASELAENLEKMLSQHW